KGGGRKPDLLAGNRDLPPTQDVTIEAAGTLELAHVEDEMAQLFDLQIDAPPPDSRSGYSKLSVWPPIQSAPTRSSSPSAGPYAATRWTAGGTSTLRSVRAGP